MKFDLQCPNHEACEFHEMGLMGILNDNEPCNLQAARRVTLPSAPVHTSTEAFASLSLASQESNRRLQDVCATTQARMSTSCKLIIGSVCVTHPFLLSLSLSSSQTSRHHQRTERATREEGHRHTRCSQWLPKAVSESRAFQNHDS